MNIKEITIFKERKVNIGNYETTGLSVGLVIETDEKEVGETYQRAEKWIDAKLQMFEDKWKNPRKFADALTKENIAKKEEVPFK